LKTQQGSAIIKSGNTNNYPFNSLTMIKLFIIISLIREFINIALPVVATIVKYGDV